MARTDLEREQEGLDAAPNGGGFDPELDVERVDGEAPDPHALIEKAAGDPEHPDRPPPELSDEEQADATAWLLSSFEGEQGPTIQHLRLNVGSREAPKWIPWTVRGLQRDAIAKIREQAEGKTGRRRGADLGLLGDPEAAFRGNLRLVQMGTVEPDIAALAAQKGTPPEWFLRGAFAEKGGLIDYLAGEILALSGFDEDAVEDALVVRAAGNSRD
jgi:hypothetical protein